MRAHRKSRIRALITPLILGAITCIWGLLVTQRQSTNSETTQNAKPTEPVVLREKRPELGVEYLSTGKLKLASRKKYYRIGELVSLDAALINISSKPIFLRDLRDMEFLASSNAGEEIDLVQYVNVSSDATPDRFPLVRPGEIIQHTVHILVGCNKQAFANINLMLDARNGRTVFDRNLFVSWGQGCLDIRRSGTYTLSAKRTNEYVVVSSDTPNTQTAVGSVESNALSIIVNR